MLAQVSWQILNTLAQLPVLSDARMVQIEANLLKMIFEIVRWAAPFSAVHHARKLVESVLFESKSFAHLSRSGALTISNDVRRHCGAELAISLIHVLNHLLSLVSARKIQVNIRPFAAFFREKTLKEQFHPDRIDRRNSKGVANRAVCSRPTSLHQDFLFAAKSNDVPDDQEVPGKMQLFANPHRRLIAALFNNVAVSLQFDINILSAEYGRQQFNVLSCILETLV